MMRSRNRMTSQASDVDRRGKGIKTTNGGYRHLELLRSAFEYPMMSNPLFIPSAPTNIIPQPTMMPNNDPSSKVPHDHGFALEEAIKIPSSYPHIHQYSSPIEVEKMVKNEEHEELAKKMKSLEQSIRDITRD
ncbi:hypothetical protein H5410_022438 [Solanum commersonii]|uniref:Uncharacterized protein n=1 Tax=Solanum commersonii TaxID=4109 RepID=A0A9J5ZFF7_SOLCO|nr:hypothetical protein H5410_022438 [Solanum commersonii]